MTTRVGETFPAFYHDADGRPVSEVDPAAIEAQTPRHGDGTDVPILCTEIRRLRAALAHYADENNWHPLEEGRVPARVRRRIYVSGAGRHGWDVAREALGGGADRGDG